MTDEELAAIKARAAALHADRVQRLGPMGRFIRTDVPALLAEIDRLRGKQSGGWVLTNEGHERVTP